MNPNTYVYLRAYLKDKKEIFVFANIDKTKEMFNRRKKAPSKPKTEMHSTVKQKINIQNHAH